MNMVSASVFIETYQNNVCSIETNETEPILWIVDNVTNAENSNTIHITFTDVGNHYVSANNEDYIINCKPAIAVTEIEILNESNYNKLILSMKNDNWTDIGEIITYPYTNVIGKIFYIFVFILPFIILWKENENMGVPTILAFIFGCLFIGFIPAQFMKIIIFTITIIWTYTLYEIWRKK